MLDGVALKNQRWVRVALAGQSKSTLLFAFENKRNVKSTLF